MKKRKVEKVNFQISCKEFQKAKKILKMNKVEKNATLQFFVSNSSGIGKSISMKIEGIEEIFDITDYSSW
jgi:ribosomal protein L22